MLDRSDAAQPIGQSPQQRQPVVADRGVVDVDHDLVEEGVDLRAQAGEAAEDGDVIALRQGIVRLGHGLRDGVGKFVLRTDRQQRTIHRIWNLVFGFPQDVPDALVGGSQCFGFR